MCVYVCVCVHVLNMTHVFAGVCLGRARECESEIYIYIHFFYNLFYCYFKCTFLSLELMCQRKIFTFMLCILMNNKDLLDLI